MSAGCRPASAAATAASNSSRLKGLSTTRTPVSSSRGRTPSTSRAEVERTHGIAAVAACDDEQWRQFTAANGWPVGVVAHHVAEVQGLFAGVIAGLAGGAPASPALTSDGVEQNNRRHAKAHANADQAEPLDQLRRIGPALVGRLRGLDDAALDRTAVLFDGQPLTAAQVAKFALLVHIGDHLAGVRATMTSGAMESRPAAVERREKNTP